jgi:type II secretory pathway pseudopilin PulG
MKSCLWIKGYSLVEASFGLIIMGLITAALIPTIQTFKQAQKQKITEQRAKYLETLLNRHNQIHDAWPCPANPSNYTTPSWGEKALSCDASPQMAIGIIPFKTLGILEKEAKDGFGNYFTYVVQPPYTKTNGKSKWYKSDFTYASPTDKSLSSHTSASHPLKIYEKGAYLENKGTTTIIALLISHGKKGYGSFQPTLGHRLRKKIAPNSHLEKQENASDSEHFYFPSQTHAGNNDDSVYAIYNLSPLGTPHSPQNKQSMFKRYE